MCLKGLGIQIQSPMGSGLGVGIGRKVTGSLVNCSSAYG